MTKERATISDKYAVVTGYAEKIVSGPYYVVGVRRSTVALATTNAPDANAEREWTGSRERLYRRGVRFSSSHAEPWTDEHEAAVTRQRVIASIRRRFDAMALGGFKGIDVDRLRVLCDALDAVTR